MLFQLYSRFLLLEKECKGVTVVITICFSECNFFLFSHFYLGIGETTKKRNEHIIAKKFRKSKLQKSMLGPCLFVVTPEKN